MPSLDILRVVLGLLCVLFAFELGKVVTRLQQQRLPLVKGMRWFLRTFVTAFAVFYTGGFDKVTIGMLALIVTSFGAGAWTAFRPKHDDSVHLNLQ